ncbi:MAG: Hint domain-containing protein [Rhodobacteraceae bacterium]|nr:Hint domain-containing protein [Paracoccaceae bacterium]
MINVTIYEVSNSYVSAGSDTSILGLFQMTITDDDPFLHANEAIDPGSPQNITVAGQGAVTAYQFVYDDVIRWRNPGGWKNETVKTFQLVIDNQVRSFIMNDSGGSISGMQVGSQVQLRSFSDFTTIPYSAFPCFVSGTLIDTAEGPLPVEVLRPGDLIITMDNGARPLRWVGASRVSRARLHAEPDLAPVRLEAGSMGGGLPLRPLQVSPQHRVLLQGWQLALHFGLEAGLAPARGLLGWPGVTQQAPEGDVTYWHLMFDRHEVIFSEGLPTESFYLGETIRRGLPPQQLGEILRLFPDLAEAPQEPARPLLRVNETRSLSPQAA